jgi:hypothetical protein
MTGFPPKYRKKTEKGGGGWVEETGVPGENHRPFQPQPVTKKHTFQILKHSLK